MNCCTSCFKDYNFIGHIESYKISNGTCDFCESSNVSLLDCSELADFIQPYISLFELDTEDSSLKITIHNRIVLDWPNLFTDLLIHKGKVLDFLKASCEDLYTASPELFTDSVRLKLEATTTNQLTLWENFVDEIKYKNRFFINQLINTELLSRLLKNLIRPYNKNAVFFRARISNERKPIDINEMGKPPVEKTVAGRANPRGIPYLYLSRDRNTTLYETRATLYDYVTVGKFTISNPIEIIDLSDISGASLMNFDFEENLADFIIHKNYLIRLEQELSKPVRRNENELDYLPTQFLCEFIKSEGYVGVQYRSSLNSHGFNLAIFDDEYFECTEISLHEIHKLKYDHRNVEIL